LQLSILTVRFDTSVIGGKNLTTRPLIKSKRITVIFERTVQMENSDKSIRS
jgi:hypothetical protein